MGNSTSRRRPKEYSISPGEDAVQALITSPSVSLLQDNTIFLNESFFSLDPDEMDDNNSHSDNSRFVIGTEEFPECLNSSNFHTSFFASLVLGGNKWHQSASPSLINIVDSHRWSVQCPEYVALCASFILSILHTYGQCIPNDRALMNQKSIIMFNALEDLYEFLSKMKQNSWHPKKASARWKSCRDCDVRQMVLMQVNFQNGCTKKLCPVCLQFASVCKTDSHNMLKTWLLADIYPFCCSICQMRFTTEVDLQYHSTVDCLNVIVDGQVEKVSSQLFCCFLCCVPFKTRGELTVHCHSSLEHALRREVALELALRNTKAPNKFCQSNSDVSLSNVAPSKQLACEENLIETTTSSPDVSDAQYYCSPCCTFVQKCNVVEHERGLKHRLKCEGWMKCLKKKSKEPCHKADISSENKSSSISEIKVLSKDASTSMDNSEYESLNEQVENLLEEFFLLEKDQVLNCTSYYLCIKCSYEGKAFEMLSHRLGKNQNDSDQCCGMNEEALDVLEAKLQILTTLMSLCVVTKMYDLLKLISMNAVQRLIDAVCIKKGEHGCVHGDKLSQIDETYQKDDFKKNDSISISASIHESYNSNEEISEELCLSIPAEDDITFTEISETKVPEQPNKELDHTKFVLNATITEKDVIRATEKFILLEKVESMPRGQYKCQSCGVTCNSLAMLNHVMGKNHLKLRQIEANQGRFHSVSTLTEKFHLIRYFEFLKGQKCALVSHIHRKQLDSAMTSTHTLLKMSLCMSRGCSLAESCQILATMLEPPCLVERPGTKNIRTEDVVSSVSQLTCSITPSPNNVALSPTDTRILEETKNETRESLSSGNRITIGESVSVSLQEQMQNACAGRDLSDFEMECGTCGAVFPIFNDDVDLSLDIHIQTDTQHALATAVPLERNVQRVAEFTPVQIDKTTEDHTKPQISESKENKSKLLALVSSNDKQVSESKQNKERLCDEVLKLEQKYVVPREGKYYCQLCAVQVNSTSQIVHHILSPKHISPKWLRRHSPDELELKLQLLKSLLKYKYAGNVLILAIGNIHQFLGNPPEFHSLNVVEPSRKESPATFYCEICKISMTVGSKLQHLRGKRHTTNTSVVLANLNRSTNS